MQKVINVKNDCRGMNNEEILNTIFKTRGIKNVEHFMNPKVEDLLPIDSFSRIDEASKIVLDGIKNNKRFMVYADTDLDGCASGAIMIRYLRDMGVKPEWYINKGKLHGITPIAMQSIDTDILIIVDSLNSTNEYYKELHDKGIQIIVLDHHDIRTDVDYDTYITLVSSNRDYKNKELCGSGVVWKFCMYLDDCLGTIEAEKYIDLAGCGILADMMDISETHLENRFIVKSALDNLNNPALRKIVGSYAFNSNSVSFSIAPLINAACRYNENESALLALLADDNREVLKYVRTLKKCRENQIKEVDELLPDVIEQAEKQKNNKMIFVIIDTENGITGLIGAKLLDRYQRPVLVLKEGQNGYSGSSRAIGVDDFRSLCESTNLCTASGHPSAFGIVIAYEDFDSFCNSVENKLKNIEFKVTHDIDIKLELSDLNDELFKRIMEIDRISGVGFPHISVAMNIDRYEVTNMGNWRHLVLKPAYNVMCIKWNFNGSWDDYEDASLCNDEITCFGSLQCGFMGKKYNLQLICEDMVIN